METPLISGLLSDWWFYISAGGFAASVVLFAYFLSQYRAAVESEDIVQAGEGGASLPPQPQDDENADAQPLPASDHQPVGAVLIDAAPHSRTSAIQETLPSKPPETPETMEAGINANAAALADRLEKRLDALESSLEGIKAALQSGIDKAQSREGIDQTVSELAMKNSMILERLSEVSESVVSLEKSFAKGKTKTRVESSSDPAAAATSDNAVLPARIGEAEAASAPSIPEPVSAVQAESAPQFGSAKKGPVWPI
ncbi:MAG: hypothetical protein ACYCPQ_04635 [Elusimicrobiota bacterium]